MMELFCERKPGLHKLGLSAFFVVAASTALPAIAQTSIAAALLPTSRSVQVNQDATFFATIINGGSETAISCKIERDPRISGRFSYQTTDPTTNEALGVPNTPVDIPPNGSQSFVVSISSNEVVAPIEFEPGFSCDNAARAPVFPGINTLLFSASDTPVSDVVALVSSASGAGFSLLSSEQGSGAFVVASANVGAQGTLTMRAQAGPNNVPVDVFVCRTNPLTGVCMVDPVPNAVEFFSDVDSTASFAVFLVAREAVAEDAARNRVFVRFIDTDGVVRGSTSLAVRIRDSRDALPLSLDNVEVVTDQMLRHLGVFQRLTDSSIAAMGDLDGRASFDRSCFGGGGSESHELIDNDGSQSISAGDEFLSRYDRCQETSLFLEGLSGQTRVLIDQISIAGGVGSLVISGDISTLGPVLSFSDGVGVDGQSAFEYTSRDDFASLRLLPNGLQPDSGFRATDGLGATNYSAIDFVQSREGTDPWSIQVAYVFASESFRGRVNCSAGMLTGGGTGPNPPSTGELVCTSADGTALLLDTAEQELRLNIGPAGDFSAGTSSYLLSRLAARNFRLAPQSTSINSGLVDNFQQENVVDRSVTVTAMVVSELTNRIYVLDEASLLVIAPETLEIEESFPLGDNARTLAITDDGSRLYIGRVGDSELKSFDTVARTFGDSIDLGVDAVGEPYFPVLVAPLPGSTRSLIVARNGQSQDTSSRVSRYTRYDDGVAAPNTVEIRITFPSGFVMPSAEQLLISDQTRTTSFRVNELGVERSGEDFDGFLGALGAFSLTGPSGTLLDADGRLVNLDQRLKIGTYAAGSLNSSGFLQGLIDLESNRHYALSGSQQLVLSVQDQERFQPLAQFETVNLNNSAGSFEGFVQLGDRLVAAFRNRLVAMPVPQVAQQGVDVCASSLLSELSIDSQGYLLDCDVRDIAYVSSTGQFLLTVPTTSRQTADQVAFVDAQSGALDRLMPVGSGPELIDVSADAQTGYLSFTGTNRVFEFGFGENSTSDPGGDMGNYSVPLARSRRFIEFDGVTEIQVYEPRRVASLATSPFEDRELLIGLAETHPLVLRDGVLLETFDENLFTFSPELLVAYNSQRAGAAFGTRRENLVLIDVTAAGAATTSEAMGLLPQGATSLVGDNVYSIGGQKLNPDTLAVEQTYDLMLTFDRGFARSFVADPSGGRVYFLVQQVSGFSFLAVFNESTGEFLGDVPIPAPGNFFDRVSSGLPILNADDPERLVISGDRGVLVLPRSELEPQ